MVKIVVYGEPVAQGRPKFFRAKWGVVATDPLKSKNYKEQVRLEAQKIMQKRGGARLEGALSLTLDVYKSIPKSWSQKKQKQALESILRPTTKPDLDNYLKGVQDALSGVVYGDDSYITSVSMNKWYSDRPRIEVTIDEFEQIGEI